MITLAVLKMAGWPGLGYSKVVYRNQQCVLAFKAWLLLAIATWGAFGHYGLTATWKIKILSACLAPTLLLLWGRFRRPDTCKVWRRRLRKALR